MLKGASLICGVIILSAPFALPQKGKKEEGRLEKVEARKAGKLKPLAAKVDRRKVRRLIRALGSGDEEVRERAAAGLEEMGKGVLPLLRKAVEKEDSPEIRWRLKRVIRAVEGKGPRTIPKGEPPVVTPGESEDFLEEMQERLRRMMEEMEKDFAPFFGPGKSGLPRLRIPRIAPGRGGKVFSRNESVQIRIGPDGVVMVIRKKGPDGKEEVKRYKAKSVEEFRKLYPDVARKYHIGGNGFSFRIGEPTPLDFSERLRKMLEDFGLTPGPAAPKGPVTPGPGRPAPWWGPSFPRWWSAPPLPPRGIRPLKPLRPLASSGEKLGVYVEPVPEPLASYLSLPRGVGLMVRQVLPGSLAERAGIQEKDIVIQVQDRRVASPDDVREALAGTPAGGKVTITVIRRGAKVVLTARKAGKAAGVKRLKKVKV